jgi:hypothetical protein
MLQRHAIEYIFIYQDVLLWFLVIGQTTSQPEVTTQYSLQYFVFISILGKKVLKNCNTPCVSLFSTWEYFFGGSYSCHMYAKYLNFLV